MNYLVDPQSVVFNSHRVSGFTKMIVDEHIPQWDLLEMATEVAEEWTNDWPEDQGFGSSDGTYMMKEFIDNVIGRFAWGRLQTRFTPSLSIVEYSEAEYHNKVQRMESGI